MHYVIFVENTMHFSTWYSVYAVKRCYRFTKFFHYYGWCWAGTKDNCCDNLTPFQGHTFVACPITAKYCVETPFYLRGTHIPYVPYTCISYFSVEYVAALSLIAKSPALIINSLKSSFNGIGFFISTFYVKHFCLVFFYIHSVQ